MKVQLIKVLLVLLFFTSVLAQNRATAQELQGIKLGLKIPYSYTFSYYQQFTPRFAFSIGSQIVTYPFNNSMIGMMNAFGADPNLTAILKSSYKFVWGFEGSAYYFFGTDNRRYYVNVNVQWMNFLKQNLADSLVNAGLGVDLSTYPIGPIDQSMSQEPLTLTGGYLQIGLVAGKKFFFMNPKYEVHLEVGLAKSVGAHFRLQSDYRYISPVDDLLNEEMKKTYKKFGWVPTINAVYIIKLKS